MNTQEEILEDVLASMDGSALNPSVKCGIDEFTIVLQPAQRVQIDMWVAEAQNIMQDFLAL